MKSSADGPLSHIIRASLPWRERQTTECGKRAKDVAVAITRDEARAMQKRLGKVRASYQLCMTCATTSGNHQTWEQNPASVLCREFLVASYGRGYGDPDESERDRNELRAIAMLIEAHPTEFNAALAGLGELPSLDAKRIAKQDDARSRWGTRRT